MDHTPTDGIVDAVIDASRVLLGIADRALPDASDVTLHQFRALVLLQARGDLNVNEVAELLGVNPSTVTRLCDRLVAKRLVRRRHSRENRREVLISLTRSGEALVADVLARRREGIAAVLAHLEPSRQRELADVLRDFVAASQATEAGRSGALPTVVP